MGKIADISAQRFGRLVVLSFVGVTSRSAKWLCRGDCGTEKIVSGYLLRYGSVKSCGCLKREALTLGHRFAGKKPVHGHAMGNGTPTYRSWYSMRRRCTDEKQFYYKYYGGRGIRFCARWQKFENFLADMGERPEGMTLDRYPDKDGNYEPGNCRWADRVMQRRNRRAQEKIAKQDPITGRFVPVAV